MYCDTHAHLDDEQFDATRDALVERAVAAGVSRIVTVGTTLGSSRACVAIARRYREVFAAVGIQPNYVGQAEAGDWDKLIRIGKEPLVVAVGETGLDRYWDFTPFHLQQDYFDRHLRLAQERDLPVVIHMRDCASEVLTMLREARQRGPLRGVMHSFTADAEAAHECLDLGLYVSFAGMVTFKKSQGLRDVARTIPADRILIETDSPYLSPHPKRSQQPNEPALLVHTAACLAEVRGVDLPRFAALTTANAVRLFRFPER